ncbi:MAG: polysaccharide biosynthesis/export family protein [Bacteroidota bacterium]
MKKLSISFISITLLLILGSCRNVKEVTYFQETKDTAVISKQKFIEEHYTSVIQAYDILSIYVSSLNPEATAFFNVFSKSEGPTVGDSYSTRPNVGYLVDAEGNIDMPLVGKINVIGLSTSQAKDVIQKQLEKYLQQPSVRIYFENFKVTLLGEVTHPGVYTVTNEKLTLPEAIGLAGDLSIFGNRKEVMLIREVKGEKIYIPIDLTRRDLFYSPYYYLHSNDILYIPPVKDKVSQSDNFYKVAPLLISLGTLCAFVLFNR